MPIMQICDADCKTVLTRENSRAVGWGRKRVYSYEAARAVDAYYKMLQEAAQEARELFQKKQAAAAELFHKKYPDGKLPDDPDSEDVENNDVDMVGSPDMDRPISPDPVTMAGYNEG